jgi:hypothetical protein
MRSKILLVFQFIVVLLLIDGCKKDDNPVDQGGTPQATVLMPLKIGNQWTYRVISYDTSGTVQHVDTSTFKIVRDTTIQSEKWYFIGQDSTAYELLTNRSDGVWYMRVRIAPLAAVLFAKYPANVNDTWLGPDSSIAMLWAKDINVSVPQGTYACFQYMYADKGTQFMSQAKYFPVGVGFVRDEFYSKTNSGRGYVRSCRELMGLSLGKLSFKSANTKVNSSAQYDLFIQH